MWPQLLQNYELSLDRCHLKIVVDLNMLHKLPLWIYLSPSSPSLLLTEAPLGGGERKRSRGQWLSGDVDRPLVGLELGDVLGD